MPTLIYLFGEPGAGKSTLLRDAIGDKIKAGFRQAKPFQHTIFPFNGGMAAYLGADDGKSLFPGTDRLSMGVQPLAIKFLKTACVSTVIAEGDRLGTISFFKAAIEAGWNIFAVHVFSTNAEKAREQRAREAGQAQSKTWLKGRIKKVQNLAQYCLSDERITYTSLQADQKRPKAGKELLRLLGMKS